VRIARIKIGLFALFLAAPVVVLLIFGPTDSYGRPQTRFPAVGKVLLGKKGRFDQFGDAVLERSAVRRLAIQLRNWTSYRIVGFVENDHVVSGNGSWLFYRAEFAGGRCLDEGEVGKALRSLAVLVDIAQAAGIDMIVSISPDKSTIYPDALSPTIRGYWKCRIENIAALRRIIRREIPLVIDHADPLLAEKARNPDIPLYYATDTHWTPYGSATALRQLLASVYPNAEIPPVHLSGSVQVKSTDLSRLLLLPMKEEAVAVKPLRAEDLGSAIRDPRALHTLIVHDSFYGSLEQQLRDLFSPSVVMRHIGEEDDLGADTMAADRIIVNVVERTLLMRLARNLSWGDVLPSAIVQRNMRRAEGCGSFGATQTDGTGQFGWTDVAVRAAPAGRLPCIRLSLSVMKPTNLHLALPGRDGGTFESGHAMALALEPGERTIAFVLPAYTAGGIIQVAVDDAAVSAIEVGEIPVSTVASDQP